MLVLGKRERHSLVFYYSEGGICEVDAKKRCLRLRVGNRSGEAEVSWRIRVEFKSRARWDGIEVDEILPVEDGSEG